MRFPRFKKDLLFVVGGAFLVGIVFAASILFYFLSLSKSEGRVNLILLGESGPGHTGSSLTDSIIFASVSKEGTILLSVPRDLWYGPWQTKINSLYYYGQQRGDGLLWTKKILGEVLGQEIKHAILVDFTVFQDLVDLVGGVDIIVERSFDDFRYPIAGLEEDLCGGDPQFACRYEHVSFKAGPTRLNGEQALKFVRSRYAEGEEGTDTARSARQQKIIAGLKEKLISPALVLSPAKMKGLKEIFEKRIKSDLNQEDFLILGKIFLTPSSRDFQSFVINNWEKEEGLIYHPKKHPSGQWVLLPKDDSWGQIRQFTACLLAAVDKSSCSPQRKPVPPNF